MIFDIVNVLEPILNRKHVVVNVDSNDKFVERKVFKSDFESVFL